MEKFIDGLTQTALYYRYWKFRQILMQAGQIFIQIVQIFMQVGQIFVKSDKF